MMESIPTILHDRLKDFYDCPSHIPSSCVCKELFLEHLTYHLESCDIIQRIFQFASDFASSTDIPDDVLYEPISPDHDLLRVLGVFLSLWRELNEQIQSFLRNIFDVQMGEVVLPKGLHEELQSTVCSVALLPQTCSRLTRLFEVYLTLQLQSAESSLPDHNLFSQLYPVYPNNMCGSILLSDAFIFKPESKSHVHLLSCIRPLCIPYARNLLLHRTKYLCSTSYTEEFLNGLLEYKEKILKTRWLSLLYPHQAKLRAIQSTQLTDELVYQLYYDARKMDIFTLIIEFPDSIPALKDLGTCLEHISFRQDLINNLNEGIKLRLLHPGVHTEQVLVAYNYLVRALRIVDKSHLVQDIVCRPVSLCLRQRDDAVRCIVDKLLSAPEEPVRDANRPAEQDAIDPTMDDVDEEKAQEEIRTELYSELLSGKPLELESVDGGGEDSDAEFFTADPDFDDESHVPGFDQSAPLGLRGWGHNWQPDPMEAMYEGGLWRRRMDLLSMLVSIYGSKKAFLIEYKQLLSQRLLKQRNFQTAWELRNLELLKLRFGEQDLVECEVMLKDVRDSKRIANLVSEAVNKPPEQSNNVEVSETDSSGHSFPLSAYILSAHYWPELMEHRFSVPNELLPTFLQYEQTFQKLKGNRTLQWMHKLGIVNIDLELCGRTVQLDVTPLQACSIHLFTQKRMWKLRDLAQELDAPLSSIRHGLNAFVQMGFIRQLDTAENAIVDGHVTDDHTEVFEVCPTHPDAGVNPLLSEARHSLDRSGLNNSWSFNDHVDDLMVTSARDRRDKELQIFWSYIEAMLTNLGGLTLDRIHSMMRIFAVDSTSSLECNRDELKRVLDKKVRNEELLFDGETYRVAAKTDT